MPQYAIVWHTDNYADPIISIFTAASAAAAEQLLQASYLDTLDVDAEEEEEEEREYTDELYIDAIVQGTDLQVRFDAWGFREE